MQLQIAYPFEDKKYIISKFIKVKVSLRNVYLQKGVLMGSSLGSYLFQLKIKIV